MFKREKLSPKNMQRATNWQLVIDQTHVTQEVLDYPYHGSGTVQDPFVVEYIPGDRRDPMLFPVWKKWIFTMLVAGVCILFHGTKIITHNHKQVTFAIALVSSAYTGGVDQIIAEFDVSPQVGTLGISLFVLGFGFGPVIWAPMSEFYGRQILLFGTYGALTLFNVGAAVSKNITCLLIMRFFAGTFGSSPLTNSGGVIADMFPASHRGLAMTLFAIAPSLGPAIGPIAGGFLGQAQGWRWVEGFMAIFTGALWIIAALTVPETYTPVILRRRAAKMSKMTGKVYKSKLEINQGHKTVLKEIKIALTRPWVFLFTESVVLILSVYQAIIYGTLYLTFAAFPIVYQEGRGWSVGVTGLSFLGVAVGVLTACLYSIWDNRRYTELSKRHHGMAPPEARLPPSMIGCIILPAGLFVSNTPTAKFWFYSRKRH
jgi:multidrug resistance protein